MINISLHLFGNEFIILLIAVFYQYTFGRVWRLLTTISSNLHLITLRGEWNINQSSPTANKYNCKYRSTFVRAVNTQSFSQPSTSRQLEVMFLRYKSNSILILTQVLTGW